MEVKTASFVISNSDYKKCPKGHLPEYAFIGRSNVGKSSLINMLTNQKKLAMTSSRPGKTQLINHFIINDSWLLADLPGYGYAKTSRNVHHGLSKIIYEYLCYREQLTSLFVLVDSRHPTLKIDQEFMVWLGENGIPFSIILTKIDKLSKLQLSKVQEELKKSLEENWEELPKIFISSALNIEGKNNILEYIHSINMSQIKKP